MRMVKLHAYYYKCKSEWSFDLVACVECRVRRQRWVLICLFIMQFLVGVAWTFIILLLITLHSCITTLPWSTDAAVSHSSHLFIMFAVSFVIKSLFAFCAILPFCINSLCQKIMKLFVLLWNLLMFMINKLT